MEEFLFELIPRYLETPVFVILGCIDSNNLVERYLAQNWIQVHIHSWSRIMMNVFQSISCSLNPIILTAHSIHGVIVQLYEHGQFMNWRIVEHSMHILFNLLSAEHFKFFELDVVLQEPLNTDFFKFDDNNSNSIRNVDGILLFALLYHFILQIFSKKVSFQSKLIIQSSLRFNSHH